MLLSVLLASVTVAAYWPLLQCGFINYDDPLYVTANSQVQAGLTWPGVLWAFTTHHASNWHPLTWLSHMLDCQLFGLNPARHHLVSLLLHVGNTLLLFGLLSRLTRAPWPSALVALWFGLHPTHVESVAWIAERKDVLSAWFCLLTLWAYARYAQVGGERWSRQAAPGMRRPSPQSVTNAGTPPPAHSALPTPHSAFWYGAALFCFALGLMAKPMLVTLPFILLLLDFWPLARFQGHHLLPRLLEKLLFLLLAVLSCSVTLWAQHSSGSVISLQNFPIADRLANALHSYWSYIQKSLWPSSLAVFYPYGGPHSIWRVLCAGLALLVVTAAALRARKHPYLAVGWLWFVGTLVPVIGLVQVGTQAMADRYLYLPSIGLFLVIAFGLCELVTPSRLATLALAAFAGLTLAGCLLATRLQVSYWRDSETLLRHALSVTEGNYVAYNNLGTVLEDRGLLDQAMTCYVKSLHFKPDQAEAQINLGRALMNQGRLEEAEVQLRQVVQTNPQSYSGYYNLGNLLFRRGKTEAATAACQQALALHEDFPAAHNNLGCLLATQGTLDEAVGHFRRSLQLRPADPETLNNLGSVLTDQARPAAALAPLTKAIQLKPGYTDAHYNLANAYAALKQTPLALAQYQAALRLNPNHDWALFKLGNLALAEGKPEAAVAQYRAALAVNANLAEAHYQLATLLVPHQEVEEGIQHLREALRLKPNWLEPLNNLAWLLATHPKPKYRNGPEAVRLAAQAVELTSSKDDEALDTLAAAYAETGYFIEAVKTSRKAIELAELVGHQVLAGEIQKRRSEYEAGRPHRE